MVKENPRAHAVPRFSISYMDASADPRRDFYRYASGTWLDTHQIPPDKTAWGSFYELQEWNMDVLHHIAEDCASDTTAQPGSHKRLVGDFYASAMNEELAERLRFKPIEDLWNLVSEPRSKEELAKIIPKLHLAGSHIFFNAYSEADSKNSAIYALYLEQGGLSLPDRDYYMLDSFAEIRDKFRVHMHNMFMLKGMPEDQAEIYANAVLELETKMAKASRSGEDLRDVEKNYNRIETKPLETRFRNIGLKGYMDAIGVPDVQYIVMGQPEFFDYVEKLFEEESTERLRMYLRWHVLMNYARFLHDEVYKEGFDFFARKLNGQQQPEPRWRRSISLIDLQIGEALGAMYVEKQFGERVREKAQELVENLIEAFRELLNKTEWMSEETRKLAIWKLNKMGIKIGYPTKFRDYSGLVIKKDDYVGNVMRSEEFELRREASRTGKPVDTAEWDMTPPTVDAYYSAERNEIVFPAGILQPPFFDANMDDAANYGSIGAIIGHEITHGFDDQGRRYDSDGNLHDWWTEDDARRFNEKAEEVVRTYSLQETLPKMFINGKLTLGENIADLGGLKMAYDALQEDFSKNPERKEAADGFVPEQRFFIAYAQTWKENTREQALQMGLITNPHAPEKYRVIIPVMNHPAFYRTFPAAHSGAEDAEHNQIGVW